MRAWLGLAAVVAAGCGARPEPAPVWVGHVASRTGPERARGESARRGMLLAVKEGKQEKEKRRLAVRHADGARDPRAEAVRLLSVNRVAALLAGPDAAAGAAAARAAAGSGAAVVVVGDHAEERAREGVDSLAVPPADRGAALARLAAGEKWKRAAVVLGAREPIAVELASAFRRGWTGPQAEWPAEAVKEPARLVAWKPDVVLVAVGLRDFAPAVARLREAGLRGPLLYGGEDAGPDRLARDLPGERAVWLATAFTRGGLTAEGEKLARRFQKEFGEPLDLDSALAHDAVRLLQEALGKAKGPRREQLREAMDVIASFESLTGPVRWKDGRMRRRLFVVRLDGGQARTVRTVAPE